MTAPISERLKFRRVTAGLSRQKLADLSGLSECTVKFIETGRTRPKASTLLRLLKTRELGLLLSDLPEHIAAQVQPFLRREEGLAVVRFLHPLFWHQFQRARRRRAKTPIRRPLTLLSPQGEADEPKNGQHCEAGQAHRKESCAAPKTGGCTDAREGLCIATGGKGILPDSCLGALSGRRDQVPTEGVGREC
ncbi:MAG: helix-turn-helix transcriptional regulator [Myxococcales bacterium]|nr:helix-turn-helix transcriptional regulator [Myxococcales bacterium]